MTDILTGEKAISVPGKKKNTKIIIHPELVCQAEKKTL